MGRISIALMIFFLILMSHHGISNSQKDHDIHIVTNETYELANIILALTEYGRTDPNEVQKNSDYYEEVMDYFSEYLSHPLLKKVNYSRNKWKKYLSFRTDAVAFQFNQNGELIRTFDFYANRGVTPFDNHLELINDFVAKTNYREFYKENASFYQSIRKRYRQFYKIEFIRNFLVREFGNIIEKDYRIYISPLVGRMNTHAWIGETIEADFVSTTEFLLSDKPLDEIEREKQATEIHTIFTEMDHGFVNPLSKKHKTEVNQYFNYQKWKKGSGYKTNFASFNEYLTWAVYDLFLKEYFPDFYPELSVYWHYQNGERGFFASAFFADKLKNLYQKGENKIKDLFIPLLKWCKETEDQLEQPVLTNHFMHYVKYNEETPNIEITFSLPMEKKKKIEVVVYKKDIKGSGSYEKDSSVLLNNIRWNEKGTKLSFDMDIEVDNNPQIVFNWWGSETPLKSQQGIYLKSYSYFYLH
jgi:hypothetical protein